MLCCLEKQRKCLVWFFLWLIFLSETLCHACCFVFLAAEAAINQKPQSILDIKMVCGLTMRLSLFCRAFMSLRLGLYVKYTFVSRFLLFLTSELTKEDSCCALWNLCLGIFFDCWCPGDMTEKGLESKSLQHGRRVWPNEKLFTPCAFTWQSKETKRGGGEWFTLGRHTQFTVLRKCWVTDCCSDTETDATRQWYKQQHQHVIQLAAMSCGIRLHCWTIGSDLTLFPWSAELLVCFTEQTWVGSLSPQHIKNYGGCFAFLWSSMFLFQQEDRYHSVIAFIFRKTSTTLFHCYLSAPSFLWVCLTLSLVLSST